jgi:hypothetical protein
VAVSFNGGRNQRKPMTFRKSLLINEVHRKISAARQKWPALMYNFLQSNKEKETI